MRLGLGRLTALAVACAAVAAVLVGASKAADVGANDDTAKYETDGGAAFYAEMNGLGLRQSLLTVRFQPSNPMLIPNQDALDKAVENATAAGLRSSSPSTRIHPTSWKRDWARRRHSRPG
jgi:hypothetical protein